MAFSIFPHLKSHPPTGDIKTPSIIPLVGADLVSARPQAPLAGELSPKVTEGLLAPLTGELSAKLTEGLIDPLQPLRLCSAKPPIVEERLPPASGY